MEDRQLLRSRRTGALKTGPASSLSSYIFLLILVILMGSNAIDGKDIYADVLCGGLGAGTEDNPYCVLTSAFADAAQSTGDVTIHIYGSWLTTTLPYISSPSFSSLTVTGWKGSIPSLSCVSNNFVPLWRVENFDGPIYMTGLTVSSCPNSFVFSNVRRVVLSSCLIVDGGGLEVSNNPSTSSFDSSLEIYDSQFIANKSPQGGGLLTGSLASILINNTNFLSNAASSGYGGGAYLDSIDLQLSFSNFLGNQAKRGGGAYITNRNSNAGQPVTKKLYYTAFVSNSASYRGGGLFWLVDATTNIDLTLIVERNSFRSNYGASGGGGFYFDSSAAVMPFTILIQYTAVQANLALTPGGGFYIDGPTNETAQGTSIVQMQTLLMLFNVAPDGGAMYVEGVKISMAEIVVAGSIVPGGSAVTIKSPFTGSSMENVHVTSTNFGTSAVEISRPSAIPAPPPVFTITDCDFSYSLPGSGLSVARIVLVISRTTLWGNFLGYGIDATATTVYANDTVSFDLNNFNLGPSIRCLTSAIVFVANNVNGCGCKVDICGVCNGNGTSCLCPGSTVPAFINCTAPLELSLPGTLSAEFSPASGLAHASLLPNGITDPASGVTVRYLSLRDIAPNVVYPLDKMSPGRPVKTVTIDVNNVYQVDFRSSPRDGSNVIITQSVYQDNSIVSNANLVFPIPGNTLKMQLELTGWNATASDALELEIEVQTADPLISAEINKTKSILTPTNSAFTSYLTTTRSTTRFSVVDFAVVVTDNKTTETIPVSVRYQVTGNSSVHIFVRFQGPFARLIYDPDFAVLADGGQGGDGDGNEELITILVPVLVGSTLLLVIGVIVVIIVIGATKWAMVARARRLGSAGQVSID